MENTLTVGELTRRGATAIEEGLKRGPIRLLQRSKTVGIVLSASDYERLLAAGNDKLPGMTAMQWLLEHSGSGRLRK